MMKLLTGLECAVLVAAAHAATFRIPIISLARESLPSLSKSRIAAMIEAGGARTRKQAAEKSQSTRTHRKYGTSGSPAIGMIENDAEYMDFIKSSSTLQPLPIESEVLKPVLPLWYSGELTYTAAITIGSPPQPLNVILSLSSSSLFIPSSTCISCLSPKVYNSANSNTHICHNVAFTSSSRLFNSRGNLCHDTVRLLSDPTTTIETQTFGEIEEMERYISMEESWDGAIGLGVGDMGILGNMMNQGFLNRNIFSLKLPRVKDEKGEILFGGVDHDLYTRDLKSVPLVEDKKSRWAVAASSLSVNDGKGLVLDLHGTAVFETEFPFIGLPEKYVRILDEQLSMQNAGKSWDYVRSVDCNRRRVLHNITIVLSGEEFVISPWEYTVETDMGDLGGGRRCVSAFVPNEEDGQDVVLGSVFLRAFYGVFDLDQRTVSLARATSQNIQKTKIEWEEDLR